MSQKITFRAIVIGALLCFCIAVGEPIGVLLVHGSPMCPDFSTGGAIFLFFILVFVINILLGRINKKLSLTTAELITVYIMMIVACAIPSWGLIMNLLYFLGGIIYYATPENKWEQLIHPHLKSYLIPQNKEAIRQFFEGLGKGESIPWQAWLEPLLWWFAFILVVYFVMICIATIFRKQWVEKERLLFPLTQLPLQMAQKDEGVIAPFFKNKLMWLGFAIPLVIHSINALHNYFHFIPDIKTMWYIPILSRSTSINLRILFEVIGLSFLISLDVSLSLWLFALLVTLETGIFNLIGFSIGPTQPYAAPGPQTVANQGLGAMIVLVFSAIWFARAHLKDVFKKAFRGDKNIDDTGEALSYRTCVSGLILGNIFIIFWLVRSGLRLPHTLVFLFFGYIIFIGLTRIVIQGGLAYGRAPVSAPTATVHAVGSSSLGPGGMSALGLPMGSWAGDVRTIVLASAANALKLTDSVGIKGRRIFFALTVAILVSLLSSTWIVLFLSYKEGGINFGGWQPTGLPKYTATWITHFINHPISIGWAQFGFMGIGGVLMLLMTIARYRFLWWPIHPLGLALGLAGPFAWVWFSVFLGWLAKFMIVKLGGIKVYKIALPFFLGLILGSFVTAGIWLIIDFFTGMTGNVFTLG